MNFSHYGAGEAGTSVPGRLRRAYADVTRVPALLGIGLVWCYRLTFGALFPTTCKYHPSCSEYAVQALRRHGLVRGSILAGWRLLRCNPWSRGGFDPVR
jgi:putative membrane protein insertion efficiency factor